MKETYFSVDPKEAKFRNIAKSTKNRTLLLLAHLREKGFSNQSKKDKTIYSPEF